MRCLAGRFDTGTSTKEGALGSVTLEGFSDAAGAEVAEETGAAEVSEGVACEDVPLGSEGLPELAAGAEDAPGTLVAQDARTSAERIKGIRAFMGTAFREVFYSIMRAF